MKQHPKRRTPPLPVIMPSELEEKVAAAIRVYLTAIGSEVPATLLRKQSKLLAALAKPQPREGAFVEFRKQLKEVRARARALRKLLEPSKSGLFVIAVIDDALAQNQHGGRAALIEQLRALDFQGLKEQARPAGLRERGADVARLAESAVTVLSGRPPDLPAKDNYEGGYFAALLRALFTALRIPRASAGNAVRELRRRRVGD